MIDLPADHQDASPTPAADHEQVVIRHDRASGMRAIIAVHDTSLGPAAGGCRLFPYPVFAAAMTDVLRLSRAMSYKNALAGLPLGGGKSVIVIDPARKTSAMLRTFAGWVAELGGRYWTAEDINIGPADVDIMRGACPYVFGLSAEAGGGGDPSAHTAAGTFHGMRASLAHVYGDPDIKGRHIAIQGVGRVGHELARQIAAAGGRLTVADVDARRARTVAAEVGAQITAPDDIHRTDCDVLAPCAMGASVNLNTIPEIRARIVCGAANNQLADAGSRDALSTRGICYAPDYVVNAGGMLHASSDIFGQYDARETAERIRGIYDTVVAILAEAAARGVSPDVVADGMAEARIAAARKAPEARP